MGCAKGGRYCSSIENTVPTKFSTILEVGGELSQLKSLDMRGC
jgi:hypothetical protein